METTAGSKQWPLPVSFAALTVALHLATGNGYGYFRDELYYLACADHLAWGYVDQPPLSIFLLWVWRAAFGASIVSIRLPAALAAAATVFLCGRMTRRLGGGPWAQSLAMASLMGAPLMLALTGFYSMNALDILVWTAAAALLLQITELDPAAYTYESSEAVLGFRAPPAANPAARLWLALGLILGLGLMNKISVLWLGFGLLIGLLATPQRRWLRTPWPWLAGGLAFLIFSPHIIWQALNGWPTLEFMRNASGGKMLEVTPVEFLTAQVLGMNPFLAPIWIAGLGFVMFGRDACRLRIFGFVYLSVAALLLLNGTSRSGYLTPAYTILFAAGGVGIEGWIQRRRWLPEPRRVWLEAPILAAVGASGIALAPLVLPILPVESYVRYSQALGVEPSTEERKELAELPQYFADMFGWEELVAAVSVAFDGLSDAERDVAGVFVYNYGEAGAIDVLGREHDLPMATSGHNNYWLWGPRGYGGEIMIIVGGSEEGHRERFASVEIVGRTDCGYCMPYENGQPIFVARGLRGRLRDIWPQLKHFD